MSNAQNPEKTTFTRFAIMLIAIGTLIGLDTFFNMSIVYKLWPLLPAILGSGLIGIYIKRKTTGLLFLGSGEYLLLFSGLALYCNFTTWANMAQLWPLFVIFMGIVFFTLFAVDRKRRAFLFLGLLSITLSIFFFLMFKIDHRYWWSIFILVGVSILISEKTR